MYSDLLHMSLHIPGKEEGPTQQLFAPCSHRAKANASHEWVPSCTSTESSVGCQGRTLRRQTRPVWTSSLLTSSTRLHMCVVMRGARNPLLEPATRQRKTRN